MLLGLPCSLPNPNLVRGLAVRPGSKTFSVLGVPLSAGCVHTPMLLGAALLKAVAWGPGLSPPTPPWQRCSWAACDGGEEGCEVWTVEELELGGVRGWADPRFWGWRGCWGG